MKFRDTKTGNVIDAIGDAVHPFCDRHKTCGDCPLYLCTGSETCTRWANKHPKEAAPLMGYEIIEEEPMNDTKKPLSEWTLGEVQAVCLHDSSPCNTCVMFNEKRNRCEISHRTPCNWDLELPPRWTEREVKIARALMTLCPDADMVCRGEDGEYALQIDSTEFIRLLAVSFPSIAPGQSVRLADIIEGDSHKGAATS